jgi:hypothetical protein
MMSIGKTELRARIRFDIVDLLSLSIDRQRDTKNPLSMTHSHLRKSLKPISHQ